MYSRLLVACRSLSLEYFVLGDLLNSKFVSNCAYGTRRSPTRNTDSLTIKVKHKDYISILAEHAVIVLSNTPVSGSCPLCLRSIRILFVATLNSFSTE
jgi:hypothetical protein